MSIVELRGPWRVAPIDGDLTRTGADPDLDDAGWPTLELPGHWGELSGFDPAGRAVLHRHRWSTTELAPGDRRWLVLDGVISQADVWLDGSYLGDTEGPHVPAWFDVSDRLGERAEHLLAIEVDAPRPSDGQAKRVATGSLQAGPLAPTDDPGGVWRPVRLVDTGPVTILHRRLTCLRADTARAEIGVHVVLDSAAATDAEVITTVVGEDGRVTRDERRHSLAGGENRLDWTVDIDEPDLWWPAALGRQPMSHVTVVVRVGGRSSDRASWRTGLRTVDVDGLQWRVNGERLFVKGVGLGPQSAHLGSADPRALVADLHRAAEAGLDLVRIHGHVTRDEVYAAADELGLLVWQDLPFVGTYSTSTRELARQETRAIVDRLTHHPSVALWCVHDEPNAAPVPESTTHRRPTGALARHLGRHLLPSWSRSVLDPLLRRELRAADPSRAVILHSGGIPGLTTASATDAHLWLGWRTGTAEDLGPTLRRWPSLGAFLGGFGAQSAALGPDRPDGPTFARAEIEAFDRTTPRAAHTDGDAWAEATQAYQAELIRHQIETIRRLKYRPAGGFCLTALIDAERGGGFGVYDIERRPKRALESLVDAARPVVVIADRPPATSAKGTSLSLDIHVVSDLRRDLGEATIRARATLGDGRVLAESCWSGRIMADDVAFIAPWTIELPDETGVVTLDVELDAGDTVVSNRYRTVCVDPAEIPSRRRGRRR